jgi:hypothetical protein
MAKNKGITSQRKSINDYVADVLALDEEEARMCASAVKSLATRRKGIL